MREDRPRTVRTGRCLLLCPTDACSPPISALDGGEGRTPIYLGRGRAFGSGLHETTVSCLETLEKIPGMDGRRVLDVGTGTGVLALASLILGAASAVALDVDPEAAAVAAANARLNGLCERMGVFCGTLEAVAPDARFSLILANLHGDILLDLAHALAGRLETGGYLLLSGIDFSDSTPVRKTLKDRQLVEVRTRFLADYVTQVWLKSPGEPV